MDYCISYLTPEFDEHMKATRVDPEASLLKNFMPLMRMHWSDELDEKLFSMPHGRILRALVLLLDLRRAQWKGEALSPEEQAFWDECERRYPQTPIITRLALPDKERADFLREHAGLAKEFAASCAEQADLALLALAQDQKYEELRSQLERGHGYIEELDGKELFKIALDSADSTLFELLLEVLHLRARLRTRVMGLAAFRGQTERLRLLQREDAPLFAENALVLREALRGRQWETIQWLVGQGGDLSQAAEDIFYSCCAEGAAETVSFLLGQGVSPDLHGGACLRIAAGRGHMATVKVLLDQGADIHAEDDVALMAAASRGQEETVRLLLERGARPRAKHQGLLGAEKWTSYRTVINHLAPGKFNL